MKKNPVHLLVRFSDTLFDVGNVVDRHLEVIEKQGLVWFGKLGSPVSQFHLDKLSDQVKEGIPTFLFLVKGNRKKQTYYKCNFLSAQKTFPEDQKDSIPPYYFELGFIERMKCWIKINIIEEVSSAEMKNWHVTSSINALDESLFRSSSGHFIISKNPF
jgi:hypothetical protein